jgi:hypothetical protein
MVGMRVTLAATPECGKAILSLGSPGRVCSLGWDCLLFLLIERLTIFKRGAWFRRKKGYSLASFF